MEDGTTSIATPLLESLPPSKRASKLQTLGNIVVSVVGTGVLGLPFAFRIAGWVAGSIGIAIVGIATFYCMLLLVMCREKLASEEPLLEARTYGDLGYRCFGTSGRYLTEFLILVALCGGSVAYLVFIGQNLHSIFQGHGLTFTSYIFMLVPVEIGLSWIGSLSALAPFSIFADVCNVLAMGIVVKEDIDQALGNGFSFEERTTITSNIGGLPFAAGMAVFCFEGIGMTLALENSMQDKAKFPKLLAQTFSGITFVYILFGFCGYMAFGEETRDIVTLNLPRNWSSLAVQGENKVATIQNVFAVIKGSEEPDRYVLLGNHRDAWTYGAVDPSSGTAALLDIARRYSILLSSGWKPRRTIILCSWDAEEFGMIGSTEWVEQNLVNLGSKAVAYLNVDCAVQGPGFFVGSTPQLDSLVLEVTKKVKDPDSEVASVYENWAAAGGDSNIQRLSRVDSDFAPFVQHAGVPSIDMYYGRDFPVYHTAFDSYNWMTEYGDPFFHRHVAVTGVWGLLALHLADDSVLPFNYVPYANQLQLYMKMLSNLLDQQISLHPLTMSIQEFASAAKEADDESKKLRLQETAGCFVEMKKRALNDRLMLAEKGFLDADGLRGRQWFKHLVFGPPGDHESKLDFFPGIADSISRSKGTSERERLAAIQHEVWRVSRAIQRAASALRGDFT